MQIRRPSTGCAMPLRGRQQRPGGRPGGTESRGAALTAPRARAGSAVYQLSTINKGYPASSAGPSQTRFYSHLGRYSTRRVRGGGCRGHRRRSPPAPCPTQQIAFLPRMSRRLPVCLPWLSKCAPSTLTPAPHTASIDLRCLLAPHPSLHARSPARAFSLESMRRCRFSQLPAYAPRLPPPPAAVTCRRRPRLSASPLMAVVPGRAPLPALPRWRRALELGTALRRARSGVGGL